MDPQIVTRGERQTNKQVQKKIFINFSSSWLISFSASRTITNLFLIDDKSQFSIAGIIDNQHHNLNAGKLITESWNSLTSVSAWLEICDDYIRLGKILMKMAKSRYEIEIKTGKLLMRVATRLSGYWQERSETPLLKCEKVTGKYFQSQKMC